MTKIPGPIVLLCRQLRVLVGIAAIVDLVAADLPLLGPADAEAFNAGDFGTRPSQSFYSSDKLAPRILVNSWNQTLCSPEPYIFMSISIDSEKMAPMILSAKDLSLVYIDPAWTGGQGFRPQQYNGSTYLTFFYTPADNGWTEGEGVILDDQYNFVERVKPDSLDGDGDAHEFTITPERTALMTNYHTIIRDCSSAGGPAEGCEVYDSGFQEVDMATGKQRFTWMASDHVALNATCRPYGSKTQGFGRGWDYIHMNAVSKTKAGNYVANARHLCGLMLINGTTGDLIWQLGGKNNMFRDLSGGKATEFVGQHDARFINDEETELILFDNHKIGNEAQVTLATPGCTEACSSVRKIRLDYENMTAELLSKWDHPVSAQARARGGAQALPGGGAMVAWGVVPAVTEFLSNGELCMDIQFAPWSTSVAGKSNLYRAYKFDYKATPHWDPSITVFDNKVYVSWNGATEVNSWVLIGGMVESQMSEIMISGRLGFETELVPSSPLPLMVRVEARDIHNKTLRSTRTVLTTPIIRALRRTKAEDGDAEDP